MNNLQNLISASPVNSGRVILAGWIIRVIWGAIFALAVLFLTPVSILLLMHSGIFSSGSLKAEETKSIWAFLGVMLVAIATLIGALLAEQNNRRQQVANEEAHERLKLDAEEAHERFNLDVLTKTVELLKADGERNWNARAAGAIATMMELNKFVVAMRVICHLWPAGKIDSNTSVWVIDRVLADPKVAADVKAEATSLLHNNAQRLIPMKGDANQEWFEWPCVLDDPSFAKLSRITRATLVHTAVDVLLAREVEFWIKFSSSFPVEALYKLALNGGREPDRSAFLAARVLMELEAIHFLDRINYHLPQNQLILSLSAEPLEPGSPWFSAIVDKLRVWAGVSSSRRYRVRLLPEAGRNLG